MSKQFTVFAILLLEKDGKLTIDDDIRKYIPEVPDFGNKITLRHLMTHTSGLRDQSGLLAMAGWRLDDHERIVKKRAYSFRQDSTGFKKCVLNDVVVGCSSLLSTAEDLCRWAMNFPQHIR